MRLYSYFRSSSAWRVRIVLAQKAIDYEYVPVNLGPDHLGQNAEGYSAVNPMRQVPTLEWTDGVMPVRLTQSVAIAEYLEEICPSPPLLPKAPVKRAEVRRAVELVNSGIQPLQNSATMTKVREIGTESDVAEWMDDAITRGLSALESHARTIGGAFSVGDDLSLADVFLVPQLYNARRFGVDLVRYPKLLEIESRATALPAFAKAHPDVQPDSPQRQVDGRSTP